MNKMSGERDNIDLKDNKNSELKKYKRFVILLLLLLFLLISGIGFAIYYQINSKEVVTEEDVGIDLDARLGILPGMSLEEIRDRLNAFVEEGMMNVSITPEPTFENGRARGKLRIENIAANHYDYIVTIKLKDTGEQIYKSGIISPGYYVDTAKLSKVLKKGDYEAIAVFDAYIPGEKTIIGSAVIDILIHILN